MGYLQSLGRDRDQLQRPYGGILGITTYVRMSLIDLMVIIGFGFASAVICVPTWPEGLVLLWPLSVLVLGSLMYRKTGTLPLFLPRCPHCAERNGFYNLDYTMGRISWMCADCEGLFECWRERPPEEYKPGLHPEMRLVFPEILGRYLNTWPGEGTPRIGACFPERVFRILFVAKSRTVGNSLCDQPELLGDGRGVFDGVLVKYFPGLEKTGNIWTDEHGLITFQEGEDALLGTFKRSTDRATNARSLLHLSHLRGWFEINRPGFRVHTPEGGAP